MIDLFGIDMRDYVRQNYSQFSTVNDWSVHVCSFTPSDGKGGGREEFISGWVCTAKYTAHTRSTEELCI